MAQEDWRPAGVTGLAAEIDDVAPADTLMTAECSGVRYAFGDGSWAAFGRDDERCTIPVWECLLDQELSRVAGVLWCLEGEVWVRNVSMTHELVVHGDGAPQHLSPRTPGRRGTACTLRGETGSVDAPSTGSWRLDVTKHGWLTEEAIPAQRTATLTLARPPEALLPTAVAMCAPLLRHGNRPATYAEVGHLTGAKTRTARDRVDRLVAHYEEAGCDRLWRGFEGAESHYAPLARLLVYRSIITTSDLAMLNPSAIPECLDAGRR